MHARRRSSFRLTGCIRQVARRGGRPAVLFVDTRASSGRDARRNAAVVPLTRRPQCVCSVDRRPRTPRTAQQRTEQRAAEVDALRGPRSLSRSTDYRRPTVLREGRDCRHERLQQRQTSASYAEPTHAARSLKDRRAHRSRPVPARESPCVRVGVIAGTRATALPVITDRDTRRGTF